MAERVRHRMRRRTLFLLLAGLAYLFFSAGLIFSYPAPSTHAYRFGGVVFAITGAVAVGCAWQPRLHWVGYAALTVGSGLWAAQYLVGWVNGDHAGAWAGFFVALLVTGAHVVVAGWAEAPPRGIVGSTMGEQQEEHLEVEQRRREDEG